VLAVWLTNTVNTATVFWPRPTRSASANESCPSTVANANCATVGVEGGFDVAWHTLAAVVLG
jgi:hypothetical protein